MEIKTEKRKIETYEIKAICPKCEKELKQENTVLMTYPPLYQYVCLYCGKKFTSETDYPYIEYKYIEESEK